MTKIVDHALQLLRQQRQFGGNEAAIIRTAGAALEARGTPFEPWEEELVDLAANLRHHEPSQPERGPTPFDTKIAQLEAALPPLTAAYEAAVTALNEGQIVAVKAPTPDEVNAARTRLPELALDVARADGAWLRVKSQLTALQGARGRWFAEQEYLTGLRR
ncbi:MAG: hypothetical protein ACKVZ0_00125 [Gemmatimonadales bacterium]